MFENPRRLLNKRSPEADMVKGVQREFPLPGSGGVPQLLLSPKNGGYRGLIKTISAISEVICYNSWQSWNAVNVCSSHVPAFISRER